MRVTPAYTTSCSHVHARLRIVYLHLLSLTAMHAHPCNQTCPINQLIELRYRT